ncbi:hypothetical protein LXA43DRAFT_565809 [Ganoderma leucocontextum]|nr:hypothetical protein LXA43DRAFT_565809 [Ganoderma leucocontextum]
MTREEPVLFTTASGKTYLFDRGGVARVMTANFIPEDYLPDFVDNASRIWSLVDCPEKNELVPSRVSIHAPQLFFVAASSPDDSRYRHLLKIPSVHCWWMSYWNDDEILALLRTAQRDRNDRLIDAAAVKSLVSEAGPCPRDLFEFLADPDGHRATVRQAVKSYHAQPRTVTRPLFHA